MLTSLRDERNNTSKMSFVWNPISASMPAVSDAPPPKISPFPSRLTNPTLSRKKERKKANPDSKNNVFIRLCSSITVLSCHSSSRVVVGKGWRGASRRSRGKNSEERREGEIKRGEGGKLNEKQPLATLFLCVLEEDRQRGGTEGWAGPSRIVLRPERWGWWGEWY